MDLHADSAYSIGDVCQLRRAQRTLAGTDAPRYAYFRVVRVVRDQTAKRVVFTYTLWDNSIPNGAGSAPDSAVIVLPQWKLKQHTRRVSSTSSSAATKSWSRSLSKKIGFSKGQSGGVVT